MQHPAAKWRRRAALAVLLITTAAWAPIAIVQAQPPASGPFAEVIAKLDAILALVEPAAGPVVLSTGTVLVASAESVWCLIANVGSEPLTNVQGRIVEINGTTASSFNEPVIEPGHTRGAGSGGGGFQRCEFTFEGRASDVRATMVLENENERTQAALEAR